MLERWLHRMLGLPPRAPSHAPEGQVAPILEATTSEELRTSKPEHERIKRRADRVIGSYDRMNAALRVTVVRR